MQVAAWSAMRMSSRTSVAAPQLGQAEGGSSRSPVPGLSTDSMCGITPPRRVTATCAPTASGVSPASFAMMERLCSDTRETVTPESETGSTRATGLIAPVRETDHSMPVSFERPDSPWYL